MSVLRHVDIALYRSYADLKTEVSRSFIGFAWWVVEPILYMGAFYVVFELGLRQGGEGFVPFLLVGLVSWKWFASTIVSSSNSVIASRNLLNQIYSPKWIFPLSVVVTNTVKFCLSVVMLVVFLVISGVEIGAGVMLLPLVLVVHFLFILAVSFLVAAVTPFLQELKLVVDNGVLALMFLSGVFYDLDEMSKGVKDVLMYNPMAILIRDLRAVLLEGALPDGDGLLYVLLGSVILLVGAIIVFWRFDRVYPKILMS